MLTVDSYPTSGRPFYSGGDVIAQFLRSLQRPLDPDNFHLAGRNLSGRFAVTSRSRQAALVAGEHAPKDRHRTFLRLRMRTAKQFQPGLSANLTLGLRQSSPSFGWNRDGRRYRWTGSAQLFLVSYVNLHCPERNEPGSASSSPGSSFHCFGDGIALDCRRVTGVPQWVRPRK